jgi:hypothetical protein
MLHAMWVRHHLRPGEFWRLPRGEQLFLLASMELELTELSEKSQSGLKSKGGRKGG